MRNREEPCGADERTGRSRAEPTRGQGDEARHDGGMDDGASFPLVGGRHSTSAAGRTVVADALRGSDPALAAAVEAERDWRGGYLRHFRELTARGATVPGGAEAIARDGLAAVHQHFRFVRDGEDLPLRETIRGGLEAAARAPALFTVTVTGERPGGPGVLSLPYHGHRLVGVELERQLDRWVRDGVGEPSFAAAVREVVAHPQWLDLRDRTVVVLGAGAEMGPVVSLLRWGAHVVAVDLPGYRTWQRLIGLARQSPGRLSVPVRRWLPATTTDDELAAAAGVDVVAATPELFGWLAAVEGPFTVGNYVYADGSAHVRAAVAIDALTAELIAVRPELSLAFLATPTDAYCVPEEVVIDSWQRYEHRGWVRRAVRLGSAGRLFARNYEHVLTMPDGRRVGLNDALVAQQGPNYALAKRVQQWRALHEQAVGRLVSINVAPATRTRSVLRNRLLAAGYAGAHQFGIEVFDPSTSNTLMAALLVHDLRTPARATVSSPLPEPGRSVELMWSQAVHGGLWRIPFAPRSVLSAAVLLGMVQRRA